MFSLLHQQMKQLTVRPHKHVIQETIPIPPKKEEERIEDEEEAMKTRLMQPGDYFLTCINTHLKLAQRREDVRVRSLQLRGRGEVWMDPVQQRKCNGDLRLDKLNWWLNNLGVERSPDQVLFHRTFTDACLPKIYGADWSQSAVRVMNQRGLTEINYEVMAITPRRWGKTWAVAMFVLCFMLACPGIRICVFSTGKRASTSLMEIICQFMGNVPGLLGRIVKQNQEELYIADAAIEEEEQIATLKRRNKEDNLHKHPSATAT